MPGLNLFLNNRDHRKITVIDGKVGFTGGYNLANEYFNYTHPYGPVSYTHLDVYKRQINQIQMLSIFNNCVMAKKVSRSLTFSAKKLTKYFPDDYTAKDMEQVIESLLEKRMQEQSC